MLVKYLLGDIEFCFSKEHLLMDCNVGLIGILSGTDVKDRMKGYPEGQRVGNDEENLTNGKRRKDLATTLCSQINSLDGGETRAFPTTLNVNLMIFN